MSNRQVGFTPKRLREKARTANVQHREKRQAVEKQQRKVNQKHTNQSTVKQGSSCR